MNKVYLLIGGNEGDRLQNLSRAVELLNDACGTVHQLSAIYETEPWGKTAQNTFLNRALQLTTTLPAQKLLYKILLIEEKMGRKRTEKYGPRIIDIDILFYNHDIIDQPRLTIPHPEMQNRRFALVPLQEIAPHFIHPVFKKSITILLEECKDMLGVVKK